MMGSVVSWFVSRMGGDPQQLGTILLARAAGLGFGGVLHLDVMMRHDFLSPKKKLPEHFATVGYSQVSL